jgi:hypothetical protein
LQPGPPPATPEADSTPVRLPFDNTYARLPDRFYARVQPTPVQAQAPGTPVPAMVVVWPSGAVFKIRW